MTPEARAEIEALAQQALAEPAVFVPCRVEMLTPLDKPDRAWCAPCAKPSLLAWQVVFEVGTDFDCGEESTE